MARKYIFEFDALDEGILERLAEDLDAHRVDVIRWALRYYLLSGPQYDGQEAAIADVIGQGIRVQVGPFATRSIR